MKKRSTASFTIQEFALIHSLIFGSVLSARCPMARSTMNGRPRDQNGQGDEAEGVPPRLTLACDVGTDGGRGH
jgi:hypothetical protein